MWPLILRTVIQVRLKHHIEGLFIVVAHGKIRLDFVKLQFYNTGPLDRTIYQSEESLEPCQEVYTYLRKLSKVRTRAIFPRPTGISVAIIVAPGRNDSQDNEEPTNKLSVKALRPSFAYAFLSIFASASSSI